MEDKKIEDFKKPVGILGIKDFEKNNLLREIAQNSLNLSEIRDLSMGNIYKDINNVLCKYKCNWIESFIVLSSFTTSICDSYINVLKRGQINEEKKKLILNLLEDANYDIAKRLPLVTQRIFLVDGLFGMRFYSNEYMKCLTENVGRRFKILKKYNFTCVYCGRKSPDVELQVDHIIPKSLGGLDDESNLTCSCWECNLGKSNKLLDTK
jgi:hypothetical protein